MLPSLDSLGFLSDVLPSFTLQGFTYIVATHCGQELRDSELS